MRPPRLKNSNLNHACRVKGLEVTNDLAISTSTKSLVGRVVDVFRQELDGSVSKQEVCTASVVRLETPTVIPVVLVGASGVGDARNGNVFAGGQFVDRSDRRSVSRRHSVVVPPAGFVVMALRHDLANHDGVRSAVNHISDANVGTNHAGEHSGDQFLRPEVTVIRSIRRGELLVWFANRTTSGGCPLRAE